MGGAGHYSITPTLQYSIPPFFPLAFSPFFLSLPRMPLWMVVVLLGIVEGITEFIPVSSTGHLLISEKLLQLGGALGKEHWLVKASTHKDLFNILIQAGAVLAVLPLFPARLRQFFLRLREPATQDYLFKLLVPVGITGAVGFVLDKKGFKLTEELLPVAVALFIGGVLFVLIEDWLGGKEYGSFFFACVRRLHRISSSSFSSPSASPAPSASSSTKRASN